MVVAPALMYLGNHSRLRCTCYASGMPNSSIIVSSSSAVNIICYMEMFIDTTGALSIIFSINYGLFNKLEIKISMLQDLMGIYRHLLHF